MYDEMGKSIDAVIVATADHSHAVVAANAISYGQTCLCSETIDTFSL